MHSIPDGFVVTEVAARLADLGLQFLRPSDWVVPELPPETPDFTAPQSFAALSLAVAPYAAIVFSVGARPAYEDGTLADWLGWLARDQGYDPGPIEDETICRHPAVGCWGMQTSDGTVMRMRLVLLEDGGRLVQLGAMAPEALWPSVHDTLRTMLASFTLQAPRGGKTAKGPSDAELPASTFVAFGSRHRASVAPTTAAAPAAPAAAIETPKENLVAATDAPATTADAAASSEPTDDDLPVQSIDSGAPATFAQVARADDAATLRPDHAVNQRLLERGAGFTARLVLDHGASLRAATVKVAALAATLTVPYGWHVLDDGRRTLVHDADGGVQIELSRRPRADHDEHTFLLARWRELRAEPMAANASATRVRANSIDMLVVRDLRHGDEALAQSFLLRRAPGSQFLVVRATSRPDDHERTLNTAELLLLHAQFLDDAADGPAWWQEAVRREQVGDLTGAEQCIQQAVNHLGCYSQIAHLYELRGRRLAALGDREGAAIAFETSGEWMDSMAAGATSGGEGAALSLQRDEHRARLGLRPYGARA